MSTYYVIINLTSKERIEPYKIGSGSIKRGAMVAGEPGQLLMHLLTQGQKDWQVISDERSTSALYDGVRDEKSPSYCRDMTEQYVADFNDSYAFTKIEVSRIRQDEIAREKARAV